MLHDLDVNLTFCVKQTGVHFGKATVQLADVTAINGAVHSIDEVLFPKRTANKTFQQPRKQQQSHKKHSHRQHGEQQVGGKRENHKNDLDAFHHAA